MGSGLSLGPSSQSYLLTVKGNDSKCFDSLRITMSQNAKVIYNFTMSGCNITKTFKQGAYALNVKPADCDAVTTVLTLGSNKKPNVTINPSCLNTLAATNHELCFDPATTGMVYFTSKNADGDIVDLKKSCGVDKCVLDLIDAYTYNFESSEFNYQGLSPSGKILKEKDAVLSNCLAMVKKPAVVPQGNFIVTVTDNLDNPIAGKQVQIIYPNTTSVIDSKTTSSQGQVTFTEDVGTKFRIMIPTGENTSEFKDKEYREFTATQQMATIKLNYTIPTLIEVYEMKANLKTGVSGTFVMLIDDQNLVKAEGFTGSNGTVKFGVEIGRKYKATAFKEGYAYNETTVVGGSNTSILVAPVNKVLTGTINVMVYYDFEPSTVVKGATLSIYKQNGTKWEMLGYGSITGKVVTNEYGKGIFTYLLPGKYCITAMLKTETKCDASSTVELKAQDEARLVIKMTPTTHELYVEVKQPNGKPAENATVNVYDIVSDNRVASVKTKTMDGITDAIIIEEGRTVYLTVEFVNKTGTLFSYKSPEQITLTNTQTITINLRAINSTNVTYDGITPIPLNSIVYAGNYTLKLIIDTPSIPTGETWDSVKITIADRREGTTRNLVKFNSMKASDANSAFQDTSFTTTTDSITATVRNMANGQRVLLIPIQVLAPVEEITSYELRYWGEWTSGSLISREASAASPKVISLHLTPDQAIPSSYEVDVSVNTTDEAAAAGAVISVFENKGTLTDKNWFKINESIATTGNKTFSLKRNSEVRFEISYANTYLNKYYFLTTSPITISSRLYTSYTLEPINNSVKFIGITRNRMDSQFTAGNALISGQTYFLHFFFGIKKIGTSFPTPIKMTVKNPTGQTYVNYSSTTGYEGEGKITGSSATAYANDVSLTYNNAGVTEGTQELIIPIIIKEVTLSTNVTLQYNGQWGTLTDPINGLVKTINFTAIAPGKTESANNSVTIVNMTADCDSSVTITEVAKGKSACLIVNMSFQTISGQALTSATALIKDNTGKAFISFDTFKIKNRDSNMQSGNIGVTQQTNGVLLTFTQAYFTSIASEFTGKPVTKQFKIPFNVSTTGIEKITNYWLDYNGTFNAGTTKVNDPLANAWTYSFGMNTEAEETPSTGVTAIAYMKNATNTINDLSGTFTANEGQNIILGLNITNTGETNYSKTPFVINKSATQSLSSIKSAVVTHYNSMGGFIKKLTPNDYTLTASSFKISDYSRSLGNIRPGESIVIELNLSIDNSGYERYFANYVDQADKEQNLIYDFQTVGTIKNVVFGLGSGGLKSVVYDLTDNFTFATLEDRTTKNKLEITNGEIKVSNPEIFNADCGLGKVDLKASGFTTYWNTNIFNYQLNNIDMGCSFIPSTSDTVKTFNFTLNSQEFNQSPTYSFEVKNCANIPKTTVGLAKLLLNFTKKANLMVLFDSINYEYNPLNLNCYAGGTCQIRGGLADDEACGLVSGKNRTKLNSVTSNDTKLTFTSARMQKIGAAEIINISGINYTIKSSPCVNVSAELYVNLTLQSNSKNVKKSIIMPVPVEILCSAPDQENPVTTTYPVYVSINTTEEAAAAGANITVYEKQGEYEETWVKINNTITANGNKTFNLNRDKWVYFEISYSKNNKQYFLKTATEWINAEKYLKYTLVATENSVNFTKITTMDGVKIEGNNLESGRTYYVHFDFGINKTNGEIPNPIKMSVNTSTGQTFVNYSKENTKEANLGISEGYIYEPTSSSNFARDVTLSFNTAAATEGTQDLIVAVTMKDITDDEENVTLRYKGYWGTLTDPATAGIFKTINFTIQKYTPDELVNNNSAWITGITNCNDNTVMSNVSKGDSACLTLNMSFQNISGQALTEATVLIKDSDKNYILFDPTGEMQNNLIENSESDKILVSTTSSSILLNFTQAYFTSIASEFIENPVTKQFNITFSVSEGATPITNYILKYNSTFKTTATSIADPSLGLRNFIFAVETTSGDEGDLERGIAANAYILNSSNDVNGAFSSPIYRAESGTAIKLVLNITNLRAAEYNKLPLNITTTSASSKITAAKVTFTNNTNTYNYVNNLDFTTTLTSFSLKNYAFGKLKESDDLSIELTVMPEINSEGVAYIAQYIDQNNNLQSVEYRFSIGGTEKTNVFFGLVKGRSVDSGTTVYDLSENFTFAAFNSEMLNPIFVNITSGEIKVSNPSIFNYDSALCRIGTADLYSLRSVAGTTFNYNLNSICKFNATNEAKTFNFTLNSVGFNQNIVNSFSLKECAVIPKTTEVPSLAKLQLNFSKKANLTIAFDGINEYRYDQPAMNCYSNNVCHIHAGMADDSACKINVSASITRIKSTINSITVNDTNLKIDKVNALWYRNENTEAVNITGIEYTGIRGTPCVNVTAEFNVNLTLQSNTNKVTKNISVIVPVEILCSAPDNGGIVPDEITPSNNSVRIDRITADCSDNTPILEVFNGSSACITLNVTFQNISGQALTGATTLIKDEMAHAFISFNSTNIKEQNADMRFNRILVIPQTKSYEITLNFTRTYFASIATEFMGNPVTKQFKIPFNVSTNAKVHTGEEYWLNYNATFNVETTTKVEDPDINKDPYASYWIMYLNIDETTGVDPSEEGNVFTPLVMQPYGVPVSEFNCVDKYCTPEQAILFLEYKTNISNCVNTNNFTQEYLIKVTNSVAATDSTFIENVISYDSNLANGDPKISQGSNMVFSEMAKLVSGDEVETSVTLYKFSDGSCNGVISGGSVGRLSTNVTHFQAYLTVNNGTSINTPKITIRPSEGNGELRNMTESIVKSQWNITSVSSTTSNNNKLIAIDCSLSSEDLVLCGSSGLNLNENKMVVFFNASTNTTYLLGSTEGNLKTLIIAVNETVKNNNNLVIDVSGEFLTIRDHNLRISSNTFNALYFMLWNNPSALGNLTKLFNDDAMEGIIGVNNTDKANFIISLCANSTDYYDAADYRNVNCSHLVGLLKTKFGADMEVPDYGIGWNAGGTYYFFARDLDTMEQLIIAMAR